MRCVVKCVVAVFVVFAAFAQEAQAGKPYGSFVVRNPTSKTIKYQVQWGDGEWKSWTLNPGYRNWHYHPLTPDGRAPAPRIRFDYIGGDGGVTFKTYGVDFYSVFRPENGKPHVFRYSSSGRYLDLYKE